MAATKPTETYVQRKPSQLIFAAVMFLVWLAADLGTKEWALRKLSGPHVGEPTPICEEHNGLTYLQRERKPAVVLVPKYLELRYSENCGAAFSMFVTMPKIARNTIFTVAAVLATIWLALSLYRGQGGKLFEWSVPLIVAGALGNLADRARHGYVVDFIRFHLEDRWEYPTFNIADSTIFVGAVFLFIDAFLDAKRARVRAKTATASPPATTKNESESA